MAQIIEVDGLGEVEFPDDMSDEQISAAIRAQLPQPAEQSDPGMRGGRLDALLTGVRDPVDALAQLLPRGLSAVASYGGLRPNPVSQFLDQQAKGVDQTVQGNEAEYQAARGAQGRDGFDALRLTGNVVSPANLAVGARAASAASGLGTGARIAASVPTGAILGSMQPVLSPDQDFGRTKLQQAGIGAALGPVAEVAGMGVSRMISPKTPANVRGLLDEGVELTPGQILGGTTKRVEDAATSVPILGDAIRGARTRSLQSFNKAAANRALAPVGVKVPKGVDAGRDLVAFTKKTLQQEYDNLLPNLQFKPDQQFADDLQNLVQMTRSPSFTKGAQFEAIVRDKLISKMTPQGNMNGASFKTIEEGLGKEAKRFLSAADPDQRALGEALQEVLASARSALMRGNPGQADKLRAINQGWANFATIRRAAGSTGADEGIFTAAQLQSAVRAGDSSVAKGRFAQGNALMQDLSEAGKAVLPSKLPDSGTTERAMLNLLALGGGVAVAPGLLVKGLGASAAYTSPGQYVLRNLLAARPQGANALAQAVAQRGPSFALPGVLPLVPIGSE